MAYSKQTWDTNSVFNPTRMNHMEDGIYDAEANYVDVTVTTDSSGFANLGSTNGGINKVLSAMVLSPRRCACELWLNEVGDTYYRVFVYSRGETKTAQASTECIIRVWKKN